MTIPYTVEANATAFRAELRNTTGAVRLRGAAVVAPVVQLTCLPAAWLSATPDELHALADMATAAAEWLTEQQARPRPGQQTLGGT
jgi:hypothetical protein